MAGLKILLTGATGFVGSHVVERLARLGNRPRALVRRTSNTRLLQQVGADVVVGALGDPDTLRRAVAGVDVVVHLAALTHARSVDEYDQVNAAGTRNLAYAARTADPRPRRFVYLSSLAAAGPSTDGQPVGPNHKPRPLTAYGRSKLAGEAAAREADGEVEVLILRAPAVYGPRDREILRFFRLASFGILPIPAGPPRRLQLVHVSDLADAIVRAAQGPATGGLFHIAEPAVYTWEEVARLIGKAVGRRARLVRVPAAVISAAAGVAESTGRLFGTSSLFNRDKVRELLAPGWLCETETAQRELGFVAQVSLAGGLEQTASWYRENGWL